MVAAKRIADLLELPEDERVEIAHMLMESVLESQHDELDDEGRRRLHESLDRAEESSRAGRVRPAHLMLSELEARSSR
jgi:hypothetical protein